MLSFERFAYKLEKMYLRELFFKLLWYAHY